MLIPDAAALTDTYYPLAAYPPPSTAPSVALGALGTDAIFACNARFVAKSLAQYVPTYQYEFNDADAPIPVGIALSFPSGAYHTAELQYLFDFSTLGFPVLTGDQKQLARTMVRYWTRFAHVGRPNRPGVPVWPRYGTQERFLSLEAPTPTTKSGFATDHRCAVWGTP
jgi:para-nitrobenzyl esterase